jgi:hypothetical protein
LIFPNEGSRIACGLGHALDLYLLGIAERRFRPLYRNDQPISASRYGLDVFGFINRVVEGNAQLLDSRVDALVEFDDGVVWPQSTAQLVARHHFPGMFQQYFEDEERLLLKQDGSAVPV